ncbi:hypothetical protein THAOC_27195 [Thalassiosira oceanica]|uniref:SPRY domain-containing protein n=1 Tax=Thalassiosira oceanica TaxID=159749 RepID=K0RI39_THAOC|nr:hypothetical protein THAOC_27195 [Thalassiosira oceanica]|eukprot:EJK53383.1 hypothetical protein THAOC_27195 [Thalassiosira oceanica]
MLNDLEQMRLPLNFEQLIGDSDATRYSQPEDKSIVSLRSIGGGGADHATAISNQEMRADRHYVKVHIAEEGRSIFESPIYVELGVIRKCCFANWNDEDKDERDDWNGDEWEGMEPARVVDDLELGMLLDLVGCGTLSVFKDGRKLGLMKKGLAGTYCWFIYQCLDHTEVVRWIHARDPGSVEALCGGLRVIGRGLRLPIGWSLEAVFEDNPG